MRLDWTSGVTGQGDFGRHVLAVQNRERAALGLPPLSWSKVLADHAAAWAAHLTTLRRLVHASEAEAPGEGENLWMGTAGGYSLDEMLFRQKRLAAKGAKVRILCPRLVQMITVFYRRDLMRLAASEALHEPH